MNCIFCKKESSNDKSIEHIIPESLGNKDHTLPKGVVCDKCNNYFARKIEGPLLETTYFKLLRSEEILPNKKRRPVMVEAIINRYGEKPFIAKMGRLSNNTFFYDDPSAQIIDKGMMVIPAASSEPPQGVMDRFLAKAALEALAHRMVEYPDYIDTIVTDPQFDPIRNFARLATPKSWPYHQRVIYPRYLDQTEQVLHEFDLLYTADLELYFVLAIFGVEYVINMGKPSIDGYQKWLKENDYISPLYTEKNREAMKV